MDSLASYESNHASALSLLHLSRQLDGNAENQKQLLHRSVIVLSVAYWQYFHESLILNNANLVNKRCRDSSDLPDKTKEAVLVYVFKSGKLISNEDFVSKIVWDFANGDWQKQYYKCVESRVETLNTPDSKRLDALYSKAFGIVDMSNVWDYPNTKTEAKVDIDLVLKTRHQIAHGAFDEELDYEQTEEMISLLFHNRKSTSLEVDAAVAKITQGSGIVYNLKQFNYGEFIKWIADKPNHTFQLSELSRMESTTWYGNQNKLSWDAWGLIEGGKESRKGTAKFEKFVSGECKIPFEIVSFDKGRDTYSKPGTRMISFSELDSI